MKKILFYTLLALSAFTMSACSSDPEYSDAHVEYYPVLSMKGDAFVEHPVGTPYTDAGCTATFGEEDFTSRIAVSGLEDVDVNTPGLYTITYSAVNEKYPVLNASVSRTVAVCDPTVTTDISGSYKVQSGSYRLYNGAQTPFAGYSVTIKKAASGIFSVSDLMGGWYDQRAGYGSGYAMRGYIQLLSDNSVVILSGHVNSWADDFNEGAPENGGLYDPATGIVQWAVSYTDYPFVFNVVLNK